MSTFNGNTHVYSFFEGDYKPQRWQIKGGHQSREVKWERRERERESGNKNGEISALINYEWNL